ncbi:MAG TPA: hypothetical protein VE360_08405 [Pyrinomonadaceae bacterium]|jgi:hypothetical protein|nr:hypothetical protein [Pyrinomonadaceae bacterium]
MTFTNNKILPVALVAALLGGSVGAFVMRPGKQAATTEVAQTTPVLRSNFDATANPAADQTLPVSTNNDAVANNLDLSDGEMAAYRQGFNDGVKAAREGTLSSQSLAAPATRTVTRTRYVRSGGSSARRVYYDYNERPRGRSFWQKHRDKLTVAMGAGGGAIIGGLVGGKKGAAIGALAGGGGSALYTYKLRKRNRNY